MNDIRRYDDDEVEEILRSAAEAEHSPPHPAAGSTGLTLPEIQEIGREVGIEPTRIEAAARAVDVPGRAPVAATPEARFLGAPRSVSRTVAIDRPLDDEEWMRLVVLARETFGAKGKVETVGPLRTWYNGNLQVHVEPAGEGYRVRMHTLKGSVTEAAIGGVALLAMAVILGGMIVWQKGIGPGLGLAAVFGTLGLGVLGGTRLTLPGWAAERQEQMDAIAAQIPLLLESTPRSTTPDDP